MLDTSYLPFEENVRVTRRLAEAAHVMGADVEGELGRLPDASGALVGQDCILPSCPPEAGEVRRFYPPPAGENLRHRPRLTDPEQAARYVAQTGVDALSVSVGNVHVMTEGEARIDFERLGLVHDAVNAPLVIHGGTGFPDGAVARAIALGVAKFNVGSILKRIFLLRMREAIAAVPADVNLQEAVGSRKAGDLLQQAKDRMKAEVMRRMALYGSAGRA